MSRQDRIHAQFHRVATGTLRLPDGVAHEFASGVATANAGIHVTGQLCTGPGTLQTATLAAMLERWFRLLPAYDRPAQVLQGLPGKAATLPLLEEAAAHALQARVQEVCLQGPGLSEADALRVAQLVRESAHAFFALEQRCRAPERHTQAQLCATLRAALGQPLQHMREAAALYLAAPALQ